MKDNTKTDEEYFEIDGCGSASDALLGNGTERGDKGR
jgi:hypothetical protein